jgi:hypothetical protein
MNKNITVFFAVLILGLLTACLTPVERVKWSSVDLFGNRIEVREITSAIAGNTGSVVWGYVESFNDDDSDIVTAKITRGKEESMLHFLYQRSSRECRLVNFEKNGETVSPFMVYKYLGNNR